LVCYAYDLDFCSSDKYSVAQATVRKHPVSTALSNRVLEKIDKEATNQKRSRSEYVALHFECLFFAQKEIEN
jgi:hypothetical protein